MLLATPAASSEGGIRLNHVWSRIADIYGELGSVESAEFSRDGQYIVTGTKFDYTVRIFRVSDGHQMWSRTLAQEIERVAWTVDGQHVASVSEDGLLQVFRADTAEIVFTFQHQNGIDGLSASPDGRYLATGQERVDGMGVTRVFSTEDWSLVTQIPHRGTVNEIDFSSDSTMMAVVGDKAARVYNVADWSERHAWDIAEESPLFDDDHIYINTKFNPDGTLLAAGGTHGFVYIYDMATGELVRLLNKSGQKTETLEWTRDGRYLAVAGHGFTIDFFATEYLLDPSVRNDSLPYAHRAQVTDALEYMHFNTEGTMLTTAHQDGTVQLWTFMSDDPRINERRHREVREIQDRAAAEANRASN
ncbi:hypothetical protein AAW01_06675 [Aurantiacibacter gangjinensis]|uniref:Pyrrolo-quinoline quinone repeat domain-containing protein n=2 Tax=Aurantiacibacter gangjinensis TaxID=502682 RepID=A0A0G9MKP4_9SPHN|nr:hypothetical protein AAW01_06675 [Aurantiacibacter gangjinensis]